MPERGPGGRIETGEMPVVGQGEEGPPGEGRRTAGRGLTIFKGLVLAALLAVTLYGMLDRGLFGPERWLLVAASILGLALIILFIDGYFAGVPRVGWALVGLLAALVAVKGLSLTWTISRTDTVQELIRSSMYLATFALAVASMTSRRLVGPFIDGLSLVAGAVAGYGVLQITNPAEYPIITQGAGVGIDSTLGYANTVAVVVGMGMALGLGRMTQLKRPLVRGLYAALILVFGVVLYLTFSVGGVLALGAGLATLFVVGERRLEMFANLLLVSLPLAWLVAQARGPGAIAEGEALLRADLLAVAVLVAFLLQAAYAALLVGHRLPAPPPLPTFPRRGLLLGAAAVVAVLAAGAFFLGFTGQDRSDLTSVMSLGRAAYWEVAWEEWKEHPLTGTGAGTFVYTWQQDRPGFGGVQQVHNVYLEQGTETGVVAFLALAGFAVLLVGYAARAAWRATGERRVLLAGLTGAVVVYLVSSAIEWHWYIPPSTIYFFLLAGATTKFAAETARSSPLAPGSG